MGVIRRIFELLGLLRPKYCTTIEDDFIPEQIIKDMSPPAKQPRHHGVTPEWKNGFSRGWDRQDGY
jgi:hypothetical protein